MNAIDSELQRAWKIHQQSGASEAEPIYRRVLQQAPNHANGWCFLGIALHDQRKYASAVESYRHALKIQPQFPVALNNLGNSLRYVGEFEEADACFQTAIQLKPDYLNAFKNRGTLHVWSGNIDQGLEYYAQALKLNPNDAELHRNLGVIYLLQGDFERGWEEYRWRWRVGDLHRPLRNMPVWNGSDPNGKSFVLTAEQGLGDTLNFVRFAKVLKGRGADTIVYCQTNLIALLQGSPELGPVFPNNLNLDRQAHFQCSLLDVADLLKVDAGTIPHAAAYLKPADNLLSYWQSKFPKQPGKFRIGIAWQGNPEHQADIFRSIPLANFEALTQDTRVELVVLQSGFGIEQVDSWRGASPLLQFADLDSSSGAFMDTAAIMHQLDLVVTSDTAIAHLGGALGIPTWIGLSYVPDWRWLLDRSESPWYSSVRLFRQPTMGDWEAVFTEMNEGLSQELERKFTQGLNVSSE